MARGEEKRRIRKAVEKKAGLKNTKKITLVKKLFELVPFIFQAIL